MLKAIIKATTFIMKNDQSELIALVIGLIIMITGTIQGLHIYDTYAMTGNIILYIALTIMFIICGLRMMITSYNDLVDDYVEARIDAENGKHYLTS